MCGRYSLSSDPAEVAEHFDLDHQPQLDARYNIAPTQGVPIVREHEQHSIRTCTPVFWGLIPFWAKDMSIGNKMINARSETAASKPAYRAAMKYRRCLVPANGFYEWKKTGRSKQPHMIHLADQPLFAFAGLWEMWQSPDGSEIESCTVLTTEPNALLAEIHNRMPVILDPDDYARWLDPAQHDAQKVTDLLKPFPAGRMKAYPVSTRVNKPAEDDPSLVEPVGQQGLFG